MKNTKCHCLNSFKIKKVSHSIDWYIVFFLFFMGNPCVYAQKNDQSGILEINFKDSIDGSVRIGEFTTDPYSNRQVFKTIDSSKIINRIYRYKYQRMEPKSISIAVYEKNDKSYKSIFIKDPYSTMYINGYLVLDNSVTKISIDSIKGINFYSTIEGSPETDLKFKYYNWDKNTNKRKDYAFVRDNSKSIWLIQKLYKDRIYYNSIDSLKIMFDAFDQSAKTSVSGKELSAYINKQENISANGIAKLFDFYDTKGQKYSFENFIQKKTLGVIIFWSSWNNLSRAAIPALTEVYHKFGKDVAFASLSIDQDKNDWVKAVEKDKIDWLSLSGFPKSSTKVTDTFDPHALPTYIIVDSNGKVLFNCVCGYGAYEGKELGTLVISKIKDNFDRCDGPINFITDDSDDVGVVIGCGYGYFDGVKRIVTVEVLSRLIDGYLSSHK